MMVEAGLPASAIQVLPGSPEVGSLLAAHPGIAGVTFTGSQKVGLQLIQKVAPSLRPVICEMGGKNPAIITRSANLEDAVDGVARAAFGFSGQKCSSCSRVYVDHDVFDDFCAGLAEATGKLTVGDPAAEDCFTGPVINASAVERYERVLVEAGEADGTLLCGGHAAVGDEPTGYFATPSVVLGAPTCRTLWEDELFVPLVAVTTYRGLDKALAAANSSDYALTAGIYSEDEDEIQHFLDGAEASVLYCNRRGGATTGAWPGSQPISGWKGSGNTGRGTGGPHYLQQYMREQSQTVARH
jgi:1-pyrroline-5-carboxylate dehydrogenase